MDCKEKVQTTTDEIFNSDKELKEIIEKYVLEKNQEGSIESPIYNDEFGTTYISINN